MSGRAEPALRAALRIRAAGAGRRAREAFGTRRCERHGGSGAVSGSGGTGGGPCVQGGVCAPEGAICTEGSCCPCQYKCTGGRWQGFVCPSCPAPYCPDQAPAHGTPCDACFTRTEGCMYDGCPAAPRAFARCEGDRWTVQTEPCAGGCCAGDAQCGQGNICVSSVCKPTASNGCWRDEDCGAGPSARARSYARAMRLCV